MSCFKVVTAKRACLGADVITDYVFVGCNAARLLDGSLPLVEKRYEAEYGRIK